MTTYTAMIGTSPDVVINSVCDVTVVVNDDSEPQRRLSERIVDWGEIGVRVTDPDRLEAAQEPAEALLAAKGWRITAAWEVGDTALYAPAERLAA